ncbi:hypothetical protein F0562_012362 [Nyssa sinensis]|uniref:Uncharacterized protein n=1 Tax=Nyssa sinensis TaxID=561372 RepID=A0A5J4ZVB5_9ASTE|nr:hypothetical protein F0562_012362 [Nyssa sinensis]
MPTGVYESTFVRKASMWDQTPAKSPRRRMWEQGHQFAVLEDILYYQQVGVIYCFSPSIKTAAAELLLSAHFNFNHAFLLFVLPSAIAHEEVSPESQSNSISSGGDGGISGRCHCESDGKGELVTKLAIEVQYHGDVKFLVYQAKSILWWCFGALVAAALAVVLFFIAILMMLKGFSKVTILVNISAGFSLP